MFLTVEDVKDRVLACCNVPTALQQNPLTSKITMQNDQVQNLLTNKGLKSQCQMYFLEFEVNLKLNRLSKFVEEPKTSLVHFVTRCASLQTGFGL